jgi:hypothetical protein
MRPKRNANQLELWARARGDAPTPLSRATARRSRHIEAPAPKPWLCVVLGIDTARRSGWALSCKGAHVDSGEVDTLDEPIIDLIVANAIDYAAAMKLPVVLVLEAPYGGTVNTIAALGVARERWLRAWRNAEQSLARVVKVQPGQWRGPVLGARWTSAPREEVRSHEQMTAAAFVGHPVGEDEAPAIHIARWGSHAARVGHAIGKRASEASLRAWTGTPKPKRRRS